MDGTRSLVSDNELFIYGVIDPFAMEGDGVRAIDVIDSLQRISGDTVLARINSPGGSVTEGIAIYNALKADGRKVIVRVDAMAGSIASVIMLAGDEIVIAETASVMIHDPWAVAIGSSDEMRAMADEIDRLKGIILNIYTARTGMERAELEALMASETYMSASDAIERGFADRVDMPMQIAACEKLSPQALAKLISIATVRASTVDSPVIAATAASNDGVVKMTDQNTAAKVEAAIDENKLREDAVKAERNRVSAIVALARKARVEDIADKLIAEGKTVEEAHSAIIDAWSAKQAQESGPELRPVVAVVRDEKDTMTKGMTDALAHRLGAVGELSDVGREYMGHSIVDMAADFTGHRGRYSLPSQREAIIRNAMHTTSDFPLLLENSLNKALEGRYAVAQPTYRAIARQRSYSDFRDHSSIRMGDFPMLTEVNEAGEIRGGTISEAREKTSVKAYGVQFAITRQMIVNDNLAGVQQVLASYGDTVARFEEETFYATFKSGANADGPSLLETARQVFNTTDGTKASSNAAITVASVAIGRAKMRNQTSLDGAKLNIAPSILLVGPDKELEAQQLVATVSPAQASNVNPFSGQLQVIVSAQISGNAWYLFAAPSALPVFEWGLLDGYVAPRLRIDEPFGIQGTKVSLEHDFGCGAIDFRGGFKNAGA
jgi:ATP-dependent protease ClpP protease subunit/phage major head subunit gpT-like protein